MKEVMSQPIDTDYFKDGSIFICEVVDRWVAERDAAGREDMGGTIEKSIFAAHILAEEISSAILAFSSFCTAVNNGLCEYYREMARAQSSLASLINDLCCEGRHQDVLSIYHDYTEKDATLSRLLVEKLCSIDQNLAGTALTLAFRVCVSAFEDDEREYLTALELILEYLAGKSIFLLDEVKLVASVSGAFDLGTKREKRQKAAKDYLKSWDDKENKVKLCIHVMRSLTMNLTELARVFPVDSSSAM